MAFRLASTPKGEITLNRSSLNRQSTRANKAGKNAAKRKRSWSLILGVRSVS
jgi:hypothetical protein